MSIKVICAKCERTYQRTVLKTNGCPNCGSKKEGKFGFNSFYNFDGYITLNETEEEKIAFKEYLERENYLHFGKPSILVRLIKKVKAILYA